MNEMVLNPPSVKLTEEEIGIVRRAFDADFYLAINADVRLAAMDPLEHYILYGEDEGRLPASNFCPSLYRRRYPRSTASASNLFLHFLETGRDKGYLATPPRPAEQADDERPAELELIRQGIDVEYYLRSNPDVAAAGIDPGLHYLHFGEAEGRRPAPGFDPVYYREHNADLAGAPFNLFWHYLFAGRAEGREGRGTFPAELDPAEHADLLATLLRPHVSAAYYNAAYPDIAAARLDPVAHYIAHGEAEGRRPNADFDPVAYRAANPSLASATCSLLWHHIASMEAADHLPAYVPEAAAARVADEVEAVAGEFDEAFYLAACPEAQHANVAPVVHYLAVGEAAGRWPNAGFNPAFYRRTNPDLSALTRSAFWHYCAHGKAEMRPPCAYYETDAAPTFRVTAIIPNYNHARYLAERVRSVAHQTYPFIDIVILDDCSTDDSLAVIGALAADCPRPVAVHRNDANSGNVFAQWRKGMELATGDLVWICESDDTCEPDFVEKMVCHFRDLSVTMAFGRIEFCDEDGTVVAGMEEFRESAEAIDWQAPIKRPAYEWFCNALGARNVMANVGGCMFRRQTLPDALWSAAREFRIIGDWFLYSRIAGAGQIVYEPAAVAYFRQHARNTSASNFAKDYYYREYGTLMRRLCEMWNIPAATRLKFVEFVRYEFNHFGMEDEGHVFEDLVDVPAILNTSPEQLHVEIGFLGFHSGGGEVFAIVLANLLAARGLTVSMIAHNLSETVDDMRAALSPGIPVYTVADMTARGRDEHVRTCGIDLVHSHVNAIDSAFFGADGAPLDIPYVATLHGSHDFLDTADPRVSAYVDTLVRNVSSFVYTADKNLGLFAGATPPADRLIKIANAMPRDTAPFQMTRRDLGIAEDAVVFTFVARGIERKGWRVAVMAFLAVRAAHPETPMHLLLVGDGEKTAAAAELVGADAAGCVTFLGYQSRVNGIYALSDCAILPTRYPGESNPLCLIQAAQENVPIIAADVGEIANMLALGDGAGGILVPVTRDTAEFARSFADAMAQMLDPAVRATLSAASRRIAEKYDPERMIDYYLGAYADARRHRTRQRNDAVESLGVMIR